MAQPVSTVILVDKWEGEVNLNGSIAVVTGTMGVFTSMESAIKSLVTRDHRSSMYYLLEWELDLLDVEEFYENDQGFALIFNNEVDKWGLYKPDSDADDGWVLLQFIDQEEFKKNNNPTG